MKGLAIQYQMNMQLLTTGRAQALRFHWQRSGKLFFRWKHRYRCLKLRQKISHLLPSIPLTKKENAAMKSITNEPDIPDSLQQVHEDRRVVFLCGAGISVPVQLPHFIRLVDEICKRTSSINTPQEDNALKACQYDATLNLLEHWLPEGRIQVRQALGSALTHCSFLNSATETHAALLYLSKTHDNKMRLDTINLIPYSSVQLNASIIGFLYSVHQCYPCLEGLASQEE